MQYDFGDEEYGNTGRIARKQKEVKHREKQKLSGRHARDLYLECLQLMLRKQLAWLIGEKGFKAELETVVRDLWDLRIRGCPPAAAGGGGGTNEPETTSDGEMSLFSSQAEDAASEDESRRSLSRSRRKRARSWSSDAGDTWPTPSIVDTLALCYLGCLLLRIPKRIGDFVSWAKGGNIPYKQGVSAAVGL